jgi:TolB-like protein
VRRWETERGLPIHRVPGSARGVVFAYTNELEEWLRRPESAKVETIGADSNAANVGPALVPDSEADSPPTVAQEKSDQEIAQRPEKQTADAGNLRPHSQLLPWLMAGALTVAVFGGVYSYRKTARFAARAAAEQPNAHPRNPHLSPDSVAVLPFTNARGDANTEYLSDGITEALISNLAHVPQLKVRPRDSVFRYKGKDIDIPTIGSNLRVAVLVTGRVMSQGDSIEVSAELTDVHDNTEIWGRHYTGKSADIVALQQQLASDIADKLRSALSTADRQNVTNEGTQDADAYSLYLKGRYDWNNRNFPKLMTAISYFNQAIAKDPGFALAYSGIADAYSVLPNYGGNPSEDSARSNVAARRALELDPTLAHPHAVLGNNEMQYDWDFAGGEAEFKKSFELDPNDATAHQWYAENLGTLGGREQEALAEINRAHELDPLSPIITRVKGSVLVSAHKFDEAIAVCKKLVNEDPTFALAHDCLAWAYWGKHMYPELVEEWKAFGAFSGNRRDVEAGAALEQGFRSDGGRGAITREAEFLEARRKTGYESPLEIARFYGDLGDKERAFQWLDLAYREHDWLLEGLNTYAELDSLRSDPRFAALVNKVGLPNKVSPK